MGMGRTNQRFQQGGPVTAPRWSPAQAAAWRGRQAAPPPDISLPRWGAPQTGMPGAPGAIGPAGPGAIGAIGPAGPDISLPRWGAPQPPSVGIPPMGPPAKPWQPPAGGMPPVGIPPMGPPRRPWQPPAGGVQPLPGLQPIYGSPPPDISLPRWGAPQPPAGRLPPLDPYDPGRGIPNPPVPSPSPWAGRVSGLERPGATRDWRNQQWTMGGAGPNQWTDRLGRGWGRNDGGLTSLYWPGGRVY
jgi:hypothetical protein